jgi:16S rRNA U516 pseudouridylate synthase RsuA-like enzyme
MVRVQVRLTDEQSRAVKRLAAAEGVSVSEIVRRSIDAFIVTSSREEIRRRALAAAGALHGGPRDLSRNHDKYLAEAFER